MSLEDQLLFLFSALGGINGLFLSAYFAFFIKKRTNATYFLAALLFVISVRVTKSAFLSYYAGISSNFIQVGLTACLLIGPFLYLHIRSVTQHKKYSKWGWVVHVLPIVIAMIVIGYYFPYKEHRYLWQRRSDGALGWILYVQWFSYLIYSTHLSRNSFSKVFFRRVNAITRDVWVVNIVLGIWIVFWAYFTSGYTSYIVGALSFSFTFYISILLWIYRKGKTSAFFEQQQKYSNKKIDPLESHTITSKLEELFSEKELYKDPNLKLSDVADAMNIVPNYLSQYLNDNLKKSFSTFVNEYRVQAAERMLEANDLLTLEAIGNECGFKSNSTFYTAFKKSKGLTPGEFKKKLS